MINKIIDFYLYPLLIAIVIISFVNSIFYALYPSTDEVDNVFKAFLFYLIMFSIFYSVPIIIYLLLIYYVFTTRSNKTTLLLSIFIPIGIIMLSGFNIDFWNLDIFRPRWLKFWIAFESTTIGIYFYYLYKQKKAQREEEFWDD